MKEIKLDILAFGAHPDDVELGCGGTLAKEISLGRKVGIIDLTRGELGTRGTVVTRNKESKIASEILGVSIRKNLNFRDGFFLNDEFHQMEVIRCIRKYKPEIILCNAQDDRHIDHPKGASLVSDSCFLSGLSKVETKLNAISQNEWRPKNVYHYIQWKNSSPDFLVDISGFIDAKLDAIMAYSSQFYNPNSEEPETLISKKNFLNDVINRSADLGRLIGVNNAEGFTSSKLIGVNRLSSLI
jgi:bacillithiol biosynthesis deacetylase BshB1|tara:strand:+ start:3022 stop:3747 length:726 start_codon:yes stop_codon:yes gene_type:complete